VRERGADRFIVAGDMTQSDDIRHIIGCVMETLVRYFAVALGSRGITVNCVSPGFVFGQAGTLDETVINSLPDEAQQAIREWHEGGWTPMRRGIVCTETVSGFATLSNASSSCAACAMTAPSSTGRTRRLPWRPPDTTTTNSYCRVNPRPRRPHRR
jgi:hypothetical protein